MKILLIVSLSLIPLCFLYSFLRERFRFRKNFKNRPVSELGTYKQPSLLHTLLIDLPHAIMRDKSTYDPNIFPLYGFNVIEGKQGCGKTITLNYLIRKYKTIYPKMKVCANFDCTMTDERIKSYKDLENNANGVYGEMDCIAEIQTWFDCLQSKNFPASFLSVITQQRHVRRCIFSDTQNFNRTCKQIRENTYRIYNPHTFFGCFTLCMVYEPELDDDAHVIHKRLIDSFWFVHDDELRNMYDSYSNIDYGLSNLETSEKNFSEPLQIEKKQYNVKKGKRP